MPLLCIVEICRKDRIQILSINVTPQYHSLHFLLRVCVSFTYSTLPKSQKNVSHELQSEYYRRDQLCLYKLYIMFFVIVLFHKIITNYIYFYLYIFTTILFLPYIILSMKKILFPLFNIHLRISATILNRDKSPKKQGIELITGMT